MNLDGTSSSVLVIAVDTDFSSLATILRAALLLALRGDLVCILGIGNGIDLWFHVLFVFWHLAVCLCRIWCVHLGVIGWKGCCDFGIGAMAVSGSGLTPFDLAEPSGLSESLASSNVIFTSHAGDGTGDATSGLFLRVSNDSYWLLGGSDDIRLDQS